MATKKQKNIIRIFWTLYIVGVLSVVMIFAAIANGMIGYMPPVEQFENPIDKYASQVISVDGKMIGSYAQSKNNRIFVSFKDLSPSLVNALIATEDIRFVSHSGIDIKGLLRAVVKRGLLFQKSGGGGSTITQQLAKQLFSPSAGSVAERILQKPIEWVIAVQLERYYTKEEIVNMYLNKFDFNYNAVGIQSASRVYFNTTPQNLKTEEAATLIGMCKNPSLYNPIRYNERTKGRRNTVITQMARAGYIHTSTSDSLQQLPLETHFSRMDHKDGPAPYFREYLRLILTAKKPDRKNYMSWQRLQYSEDSAAWNNNPLYGWCTKNNYDLYTDGLKIYTTIDSRMQKYAEEAVETHIGEALQPQFYNSIKRGKNAPFSNDLSSADVDAILTRAMKQTDRYRGMKKAGMAEDKIKEEFKKPVDMRVFSWGGQIDTTLSPWDSIRYHKSFLRSSFMAMDPRTGHVKAYVGGINYSTFQYDMVNGGRRQIGSTMKPFVFSLAMLEGVNPCNEMRHVQPTLIDENGKPWRPRNASATKNEGEMVTVQWGLQNSSNWVTATLMGQLSPYVLTRLLRSYGFKSHIDPVIAMCLGTPDISVGEMVSAYTVFANKGIRMEPQYVTRIEDANGNTVATFNPSMNEVLTEDATYKMLRMLRSVVDGGSGGRIRGRYGIRAQMGGKTGTSQNYSDGWYMGFTPSLVGGCWVGGEDRSIRFGAMRDGQGANTGLPVYAIFMQKVYADKTLGYSEDEKFELPEEYLEPCRTHDQVIGTNRNPIKKQEGIDSFFQ